jgi:hypothetical protein
LDYLNPGNASLWFSVCFFSNKRFLPSFYPDVKEHLTEGNEENEGGFLWRGTLSVYAAGS